jgi:hypothetical protein
VHPFVVVVVFFIVDRIPPFPSFMRLADLLICDGWTIGLWR